MPKIGDKGPGGKVWAGDDFGWQNPQTIWKGQKPGSKAGETRTLPGLGTKVWTGKDYGWQTQATIDKTKKGSQPTPPPAPSPAPPTQTPAPAPSAPRTTQTPAPSKPKSTTPPQKPVSQTGDKAKDTAVWKERHPKLAAKVVPSGERAGTQMGTGKSTMSKQAAELRDMQKASQQRQAAQSGPMYSSPEVKSKMSTRTKNVLRIKENYDAYDIVLEYLLDTGHVDTIEEANYVMLQMDSNHIQNIIETIGGNQYMPNPIGNAIKTGAGIIKKTLNNPSVSNTIRTGTQTIQKNIPSGGYSTRPGDGKPYKDGPLWDGPEGSVKKPIPQPQKKPQAPMRDEPLW